MQELESIQFEAENEEGRRKATGQWPAVQPQGPPAPLPSRQLHGSHVIDPNRPVLISVICGLQILYVQLKGGGSNGWGGNTLGRSAKVLAAVPMHMSNSDTSACQATVTDLRSGSQALKTKRRCIQGCTREGEVGGTARWAGRPSPWPAGHRLGRPATAFTPLPTYYLYKYPHLVTDLKSL